MYTKEISNQEADEVAQANKHRAVALEVEANISNAM